MAWNPNVPTVTNRVQDDLDAIRENFQALADSRIVEHNLDVPNPPNGYYVRYACGLQICWHRWEQEPLEPSETQVDRKRVGVDVQFPAAFAVSPAADISQEPAYWQNASYGANNSGSSSLSAEGSVADAITNTRIRFSYDLRTFRGRVQFSYKAIGRWR